MVRRLAGGWIAPLAKESCQPALRRPDRWRGIRELFATLDVAPDEIQPALEALQQVAERTKRIFGRGDRRREHTRRARERRGFDGAARRSLTNRGRKLGHCAGRR